MPVWPMRSNNTRLTYNRAGNAQMAGDLSEPLGIAPSLRDGLGNAVDKNVPGIYHTAVTGSTGRNTES